MTHDRNSAKPAFVIMCLTYLFLIFPGTLLAADITLLVLDNNSCLVNKALSGFHLPGNISVNYFTAGDIRKDGDALLPRIDQAKVIIVDVMGSELEEYLLSHIDIKSRTVYALRGSTDDERLKKRGFVFDRSVSRYYDFLSVANIQNMIRLVANRHFGLALKVAPPEHGVKLGIYHPDAPAPFLSVEEYLKWYKARRGFAGNRPWVGLLFFSSSLSEGQRKPIDFLIREMERQGLNVLACFGRDEVAIKKFLLDKDGRSRVDLLVAFSLKFYSALTPELARLLRRLNVPVINAISLYKDTLAQWRKSPIGIGGNEVAWSVATPEISGLIEPTVLAAKKKITDSASGKTFYVGVPVKENVERLIPRLKNWIALQRKPNRDKRVAIMFYNHHQGKQNIGASYLNVFRSIEEILAAMKAHGYSTGSYLPDEQTIKRLILSTARNVGSWAPGELDRMLRAGDVIRLPLKEYMEWFKTLPEDFRKKVIMQWGKPEDSGIMMKDGSFIIPAVRLGHLVLLPEPARGWGDDPMKLYHDTTLYPHHQYLAVYLWLQREFKADAIIHLGTHATYEWTPGKQAGLSPSCAPEVLIGDIPNIYPYIVDDVGEGIQAKRRGRGVIVSHLTPMLRESGLYGEYSRMSGLINEYERAVARDSTTASEKFRKLMDLAAKTGILQDLKDEKARWGESGKAESRGRLVQVLSHYLEEIKENLIPYGMHTFGRSPGDDEAREMVRAILKWNRKLDEKDIIARLRRSGGLEIKSLLAGLSGRYVIPGEGNDPIRNPGAIPTGRDFYGFNPNKIPSPSAWILGKKAAEDIIRNHLKKQGKYPEKVAIVLWATETQRNEGVNESTALWLMGLKPRWNGAGRVTGVDVVPGRILKRPRIDVMINASGLYRDLFPDKIIWLDKAIRLAARQTDIDNLIALHDRQIKDALVARGVPEKRAKILSRFRIFSERPGSYGTGVAEMTGNSGIWKDPSEIVGVFENRTGFAFGAGRWGEPAKEVLKQNLARVDVAVHSRSSNVYGLLDNDDMFQYLGGLSMAVRQESGKAPETLITRQQKPGSVEVENMAKTLGREMRSRYLNPKWIKGMKREGYAGAREMAHFVEYLWGWQVTVPEAVDGAKWRQAYEVYVEDKYGLEMKKFFNKTSPWAYQSITARMLESIRKGYWKADEKIKKKLAVEYALNVVDKGVACCDHTCNNPLLNQMVVSIISVPGLLSPEVVKKFKLAVEKAAQKSLDEQVRQRLELQARLTAPGENKNVKKPVRQNVRGERKDFKKGGARQPVAKREVEGYKMEEVKKVDQNQRPSSSGMEWLGLLAVGFFIVLFVLGAARKAR